MRVYSIEPRGKVFVINWAEPSRTGVIGGRYETKEAAEEVVKAYQRVNPDAPEFEPEQGHG